MNNRKRILAQLLFYFLSFMFLIVVGCSINNDTTTTYTISGATTVYGTGDALANATINLTGAATSSATTDSDGNFSFSGAANGTYTLTPSLANYTFNPVSVVVVINGANITDTNFVATSTGGADTYSISGTVTGAVQSDVKITLSGGGVSGTVMAGSDGTYTFANLLDGYSYIITPSLSGYAFTPGYSTVTLSGANAANNDFVSSL
jgi:hypothetical protein